MGILNVTPDSFSDGGDFAATEAAIKQAWSLLEDGAFILDIGGESSRPGAEPVTLEEELNRVLPVIRLLAESSAVISVDTTKPEVADAALEAGAHLVNDITGLTNIDMLEVCRHHGAHEIIMHMQGEPRTMQLEPSYEDVVAEVTTFLTGQAERALEGGVPDVLLDPGFGFGKSLEHNLAIVRHLDLLSATGHPVVLGASRKASIHKLAHAPEPKGRDPGSVALHLYGAQKGAAIVRAHNVRAHVQALRVWEALDG